MKIYNQEKKQILYNVDLKLGYLVNDKLLVSEEENEKYHFEYKIYINGGKEKIKVIDKPFKPAEYEDIQVYILYTDEQLKQNRIKEIDVRLDSLDKDFRQADLGAVIEDLEERKAEFITLHNELRTLQGKPLREYIKKV